MRRFGLLVVALLLPACGGAGGGGTLTPTVAPLLPTNVVATSGPTRVDLTWTASSAAAGYDVMRSLTAGGPYTTVAGGSGVTATAFTDSGLTNGTRYYYVVRAMNSFGSSPVSAEASAVPGLTFTAVAAGELCSFGIERDGTLWSWGRNLYGILGDGTTQRRDTPVQVSGLTDVIAVAAGQVHGLAVTASGQVWAWGDNLSGNLGNGTFGGSSPVPVQVPSLTGAIAVSAGALHSLALRNDGTVWAWGDGEYGQLGNGQSGPPADRNTPTQIPGLSGIVAIEAGSTHSLALHQNGTVLAWGRNLTGCLGDGTKTDRNVPVTVTNLNGVQSISAGGGHSLAVRSDTTVFVWGQNNRGQLGRDTAQVESLVPALVPSLVGAIKVAAGWTQSYALLQNGEVVAFGENAAGQLGNGTTNNSFIPVRVATLTNILAISAGTFHGLALEDNGVAWAWGNGLDGQLGNGVSGGVLPEQVYNLTGVTSIATRYGSSYARRTDAVGSSTWAWGEEGMGTFGTGSVSKSNTPFQVTALAAFTAFAGGLNHVIGLRNDNTVWGWGESVWGQLAGAAPGGSSAVPVQIPTLNQVSAVAAAENHNLALRLGVVWQWGSMGMFGGGASALQAAAGLTGVTAIAAGDVHNLALKSDQTVWAWGENTIGQLGNGGGGPGVFVQTPGQVSNLTNVVAIAAGGDHNLAVRTDGTVWAWGSNGSGQLGQDATVASSTLPLQVPGLSGVVAVAAGRSHSIALKSDGTVWGWGDNSSGQLGDGTTIERRTPVQASGLTGITRIVAQAYHSLALDGTGIAWAWGWNQSGQLGISTNPFGSSVPVEVAH